MKAIERAIEKARHMGATHLILFYAPLEGEEEEAPTLVAKGKGGPVVLPPSLERELKGTLDSLARALLEGGWRKSLTVSTGRKQVHLSQITTKEEEEVVPLKALLAWTPLPALPRSLPPLHLAQKKWNWITSVAHRYGSDEIYERQAFIENPSSWPEWLVLALLKGLTAGFPAWKRCTVEPERQRATLLLEKTVREEQTLSLRHALEKLHPPPKGDPGK
ncbi:MAG: hypothetical protein ABDH20_13150 [Thermus sp.]